MIKTVFDLLKEINEGNIKELPKEIIIEGKKLSKDFIIYKLQDKKIPWNKIYLIFDLQNNRIFKHCGVIGMDIIIINELQAINKKCKELGWI